jgi:hypothetical protein
MQMKKVLLHLAIFFCALLSTPLTVFARGATSEESAYKQFSDFNAPLAISTNGQWRVHVDANNILRRVNIANPEINQQLKLPTDSVRIATTRSGQKTVVAAFGYACVGLVDFGILDSKGNPTVLIPRIEWWLSKPALSEAAKPSGQSGQPGQTAMIFQNFSECSKHPDATENIDALAISPDGRYMATPSNIFNLETKRIISNLPRTYDDIGGRRVLSMRFLDDGHRLFHASARLGAGYEGGGTSSDLSFAIWNFKTYQLEKLVSPSNYALSLNEAYLFNLSPNHRVLHFVNAQNYLKSNVVGNSAIQPLDLMGLPIDRCGAKPEKVFSINPWEWDSALIDPLGRWIATTRLLKQQGSENRGSGEFVQELKVYDIQSAQLIDEAVFKQPIIGLTATPDGQKLFALRAPSSFVQRDGELGYSRELIKTDKNPGGTVFEMQLGLKTQTKVTLPASEGVDAVCAIEDETPSARTITNKNRNIKPIWEVELQNYAEVSNFPAISVETSGEYFPIFFFLGDGSLWVDAGKSIIQIDPKTGKQLRSMPTPRSDKIQSIPFAAANGFFNTQGDTLSFRGFFSTQTDAVRQILDVKPGMLATLPQAVINDRNDEDLIVYWSPKVNDNKPAVDKSPRSYISTYNLKTRMKISELPAENGEFMYDAYDFSYESSSACSASSRKNRGGFDLWRSHYGSFRGDWCDESGKKKTIFWHYLNLSPQLPPVGDNDRVLSKDRDHGLIKAGNSLQIVNITDRTVDATILLPPSWIKHHIFPFATIFHDLRMVVVQTEDSFKKDSRTTMLRAYAY